MMDNSCGEQTKVQCDAVMVLIHAMYAAEQGHRTGFATIIDRNRRPVRVTAFSRSQSAA